MTHSHESEQLKYMNIPLKNEEKESLKHLQVNIPLSYLQNSLYLNLFKKYKLNPEIGFDAKILDSKGLSLLLKNIKKTFDTYSPRITLHAPFMDLSIGSPDTEIRKISTDRIMSTLNAAAFLNPESIVIHPYYSHRMHGNIFDEWLNNCLNSLQGLLEKCNELGIKLFIENTFETEPFVFVELMRAIKGLGFCFDIGHINVWSKMPFDVWIDNLAEFIGEIHLHDNHGTDDEHLALGEGNIDWLKILRAIYKRLNRMPILTLEPHSIEIFGENIVICPEITKIWSCNTAT